MLLDELEALHDVERQIVDAVAAGDAELGGLGRGPIDRRRDQHRGERAQRNQPRHDATSRERACSRLWGHPTGGESGGKKLVRRSLAWNP